jgi:NAD(P)-dependent dehydrogenase (short-subunit alcohol dehydrogenase family)
VNAVCPEVMNTPMRHASTDRAAIEAMARVVEQLPLARIAEPEEVANAALWLCSDEASYVVGVALPVDRGVEAS